MKTEDKIKVMQAYLDGKKIESRSIPNGEWSEFFLEPNWNWEELEYRVSEIPDSIDWTHVAPQYKFMARENNGETYLFANEPHIYTSSVSGGHWYDTYNGDLADASVFASYKKGNVDWKDSLVKRP